MFFLASVPDPEILQRTIELDPVHEKLLDLLGDVALKNRTPHDTAIVLAAADAKPFDVYDRPFPPIGMDTTSRTPHLASS
jgi:hypothetical protein